MEGANIVPVMDMNRNKTTTATAAGTITNASLSVVKMA